MKEKFLGWEREAWEGGHYHGLYPSFQRSLPDVLSLLAGRRLAALCHQWLEGLEASICNVLTLITALYVFPQGAELITSAQKASYLTHDP